jgi:hypothetical protein
MAETWHYTTALDAADHWQALIAGGFGFLAATFAVWLTLRAERRKQVRELDALRKSLAVELRQVVPRALGAANCLIDHARSGQTITARTVESYARVPVPVVYPAIADKIGLLEDNAMEVVIVYSLYEIANGAARQLVLNSRDPDNISADTVVATGLSFLQVCTYARSVLPKLKTGVASHDAADAGLIKKIDDASAKVTALLEQGQKR